MECYTVELVGQCTDPSLKSVQQTYILTLNDTDTFKSLHGITAETYVQRNLGFTKCPKLCANGKGHVNKTYIDIIHAYQSLFRNTMHILDPILVLEDDTELTSTASEDWKSVDEFIVRKEFMIYSLGTFGMVVPCGGGHWKFMNSPIFGPIQSIIYSHSARAHIMGVSACETGHLDMSVLSHFPNMYTFHRPITYQRLRDTENSRSWCVVCNDGYLDYLHRLVARVFIRQFALDQTSEHGFAQVYQLQKLLVPCLLVFISLFTYWVLRFAM